MSATTATPIPIPAFAPVDKLDEDPEPDVPVLDFVEVAEVCELVLVVESEVGEGVLVAKSLAL